MYVLQRFLDPLDNQRSYTARLDARGSGGAGRHIGGLLECSSFCCFLWFLARVLEYTTLN